MEQPKPLRVSPSAIRSYRSCSYRYALDYVDRLPEEARVPVPAFAFGDAIHKTLAQFIRMGGPTRCSVDDIVALLMRYWRGDLFPDEAKAYAEFERARDMVEVFYYVPYPMEIKREIAVEASVRWGAPRRGIVATGRLDRVCLLPDGVLEVIDYKTGQQVPTEEEAENDLQTVFYHTLAADAYRHLNPTAIQITYVYLAAQTAVPLQPERAAQLKRWEAVEATVAMIRKDREDHAAGMPLEEAFPPNRGDQCRSCPMRQHCDGRFPQAGLIIPPRTSTQGPDAMAG
jgi:RecB family exonuclease